MAYRTGRHWGVTIVREGEPVAETVHHMPYGDSGTVTCCGRTPFELPVTDRMSGDRGSVTCANRPGDQLVAVVTNGDTALAERICALLNADVDAQPRATQDQINAARGVVPMTLEEARQVVRAVLDLRYVPADSCTCTVAGPDPTCVVHQGRRARGPKPPNPPGCICDGSGRTCPRHGAVI